MLRIIRLWDFLKCGKILTGNPKVNLRFKSLECETPEPGFEPGSKAVRKGFAGL